MGATAPPSEVLRGIGPTNHPPAPEILAHRGSWRPARDAVSSHSANPPQKTLTSGACLTMPTKALYKVSEAMTVLSLSRSVMYELIRSGRLRSVKEGRTRLVPAGA